jgi:uncharacterized glyoxalase superfamily protein PhnB
MALQLIRSATMLATADMHATITFYRDVMGFTLGDKFESSGVISWCEMRLGESVLMFTEHETNTNEQGAREVFAQTTIALYVSNVEEVYEDFIGKELSVSALRVTFYGMKEFDVQDPTGYTLLIGQPTAESPTIENDEQTPF